MSIWLSQADLEGAMSVATVAAIFDDQNTGTLNVAAMGMVIDRGEHEVLSFMVGEYDQSILTDPITQAQLADDFFLKGCALEYAVAYAFDRHPEYVRANGRERGDRFKRAEERMVRVLQRRQRPTALPKPPANVGGTVVDNAHRLVTDSPDGTYNGGDYITVASIGCDAWTRLPRCLRLL